MNETYYVQIVYMLAMFKNKIYKYCKRPGYTHMNIFVTLNKLMSNFVHLPSGPFAMAILLNFAMWRNGSRALA